MDITLGPWTAAHAENKPLAEAMGDAAWKFVEKANGYTPKQPPKGKSATTPFSFSGRVMSVVKQGRSTQVNLQFTIWAGGTVSNVPPIAGAGSAEGSMTAEDAVRAITEDRIGKMLETIKTGRVVKAG